MTLIQTLFRRLSSQPAVAPKCPLPLQPEHLKAVSGGGGSTNSPRSTW